MKQILLIIFLLIAINTQAQTTNYTYDNLGRLTTVTYSNGASIKYTYDANGNRLVETTKQGAGAVTVYSTFGGCKTVIYKGKTYTNSTIVRDTAKSSTGQDSIYNVVNITVQNITATNISNSIIGCNSVLYDGITYTNNAVIRDTIKSMYNCDSIINTVSIVVKKFTVTTNNSSLSGCNSVVYKSITYTTSTIIADTVKSVNGCDSFINKTTITVNQSTSSTTTVFISSSSLPYSWNGNSYPSFGTFVVHFANANGCDSAASLVINSSTPLPKNHTLYFENVSDYCNTTNSIAISMKANNFRNVFAFQGSITWDTSKLKLTTSAISISNLLNSSYWTLNTANIANGSFAYQFFDPALLPTTLTDASVLLTLNFQRDNSVSLLQTAVNFSNTPVQLEVDTLDNSLLPVIATALYQGGLIVSKKTQTPISVTQNLYGCDSYTFKSITYKNSIIIRDTIKGVYGCDSIYLNTNLNIINQNIITLDWQKTYGGTGDEFIKSVKQTSDGGFVMAGFSNSSNVDVTGNHGGDDFWVVKVNSVGAIQWQKSFGGSSDDRAYSIQQTLDGGYIVAGFTQSNNGDVTGNQGQQDYWVIKLSATGILQWQKTYGGSNGDLAYSIQQTSDGGYIVAGSSASPDGDITNFYGADDIWVIKIYSTGVLQWQKTYGGSKADYANCIKQTSDGGYIIAGFAQSNNGDITSNHGNGDYWLVKISNTGSIQWQKTFGGSNFDEAKCIEQTADGGYIVTGISQSTDGDATINKGGFDYWVVKLNNSGTLQWQKSFGGSGDDYATSITQATDGGYVVAGSSNSANGDITSPKGNYDSWVVKLNNSGTLQWQKSFGGSGDDGSFEVKQTLDDNYILGNYSASNNGDITSNKGGYDFWLVKTKDSSVSTAPSTSVNIFGCKSIFYNGKIYTNSTIVIDTLKYTIGCDSLYRTVNIQVSNQTPTINNIDLTSCDSVIYKGNVYKVSTTINDTIKSKIITYTTNYGREGFQPEAGCNLTTTVPTVSTGAYFNGSTGNWYGFNVHRSAATFCSGSYGVSHIRFKNISGVADSSYIITPIVNYGIKEFHFSRFRTTRPYSLWVTSDSSALTSNWTPIAFMPSSTTTITCQDTTILINSPSAKRLKIVCRPSADTDIDSVWLTPYFINNYTVGGCDSIYTVTNIIIKKATTNTSNLFGCNSVIYKTKTYTTSTVVRDTVKTIQGCDSIYNIANITIRGLVATTNTSNLFGCTSVIYKTKTYTASTVVKDTVKTIQGCDSIYNIANITIKGLVATTNTSNLFGCTSLIYKTKTYTTSTVVRDTAKTIQGCDSIYNIANITIKGLVATTNTSNLFGCTSVIYKTKTYTASTVVRDTVKTIQGCDSIYNVANITISGIVATVNSFDLFGCKSVVYKSKTYTISTIVRDTIRNTDGCDIVYNVANITVSGIVAAVNSFDLFDCKSVVYKSKTYTTSTIVRDTIRNTDGCDIVYNVANIIIAGITPISTTLNLSGCNSVVYKSVLYTASTTFADTLKSTGNCDSVYITVKIDVTNNILGNIKHPTKGSIGAVTANLTGTTNNTSLVSGSYAFNCLLASTAVTIKLSKNNDVKKNNGVSSIDVILVTNHILNKAKLNSPYKIIAADVNNNRTVTNIDVIFMKRMILGVDTTFTGNRLWSFVDSAYKFPDTTNPFPYKDSISFTNLNTTKSNQTFIGVKLGDVNYDWNATLARGATTKPLALEYSLVNGELGMVNGFNQISNNELRIPISVKNFKDLVAMQYTLNFNNKDYDFVRIENNKLGVEFNDQQATINGSISFLWNDDKGETKTLQNGDEIFTLVLRGKKQMGSSELETSNMKLEISNDITEIEAWDGNNNWHHITLAKKQLNNNNQDVKLQDFVIYPNPAKSAVSLLVNKLVGEGQIIITDLYGKEVKRQVVNSKLQLVNLKGISKGMYFVSVITSEGKTTKKLVVE